MPTPEDLPAATVLATPEYSFKARAPLVALRVTAPEIKMQPTEAREVAMTILRSAEDAESDALFVDFLTHKLKMDPEHARNTLAEYSLHRERSRHEVKGFMLIKNAPPR